jgi:hypothetical protein
VGHTPYIKTSKLTLGTTCNIDPPLKPRGGTAAMPG